MDKLIIVGAGGFGREVAAWARQCPAHGREWVVRGFLDDNPRALERFAHDLPVLGPVESHQPRPDEVLVCAIGKPADKRKVCQTLTARGARFTRVIHPSVVIGERVSLGQGVILCPGVTLTCDVRVGDFTSLNLHCAVGHDAEIGTGTQLSSFCDITGGVRLGEWVFLGSHATVLPGCRVGDGAVIGAGSVVLGEVPPGMTVFGVPAKPLRL